MEIAIFLGIIAVLAALAYTHLAMIRRWEQLDELIREKAVPAESFKELTDAVEHATTVKQAALVLIKAMGDRLNDLANHPDPAELRRLAQEIRQHADALAEGISEHDT